MNDITWINSRRDKTPKKCGATRMAQTKIIVIRVNKSVLRFVDGWQTRATTPRETTPPANRFSV